jgi:sulfoxide reductase heme-binding subunit YedZ
MMRRLGRRWQQLHRLIYLIAALGVLHYWKMLKLGWREPLLYAAILAVLLGWRVWRRWQSRLRSAALRPAAAAGSVATSRSAVPKAQGKA